MVEKRKVVYRRTYFDVKKDRWFDGFCTYTETILGKASWTSQGKGFGRRTGWLVPGKFTESRRDILFSSSARSGKTIVPGSGGVYVRGSNKGPLLDSKTGQIVVHGKERCKYQPQYPYIGR
jgi:hypothetical protein